MRKLVAVAALLVTPLLPATASAQIFIGIRGAYALPWGDFETSSPVKDFVASEVPITLDLGLKLGRALAVGAYASYAVVQPAGTWLGGCDLRGSACSAADLRLGAQVNLHASSSQSTELWVGVAAGYEELRQTDSLLATPEATWKGYDATLQGGLDFLVTPSLRFGPFASLTVGEFTAVRTSADHDISSKELHGWVQIGLRAMFAN